MRTQYATRSRLGVARQMGLLAAAGLAIAVVAGCGDDGEQSAQRVYATLSDCP